MKVYKYFNSYFEEAILQGHYQINTFSKLRSQEKGGAINDPNEGVTHNHSGDLNLSNIRRDQKKIRELRNFAFIDIQGACSDIQITNSSITNGIDAHLFCVTTARNDSYWKDIGVNEGGPYDRCIEISNFYTFAHRINFALQSQHQLESELKVDHCFIESNEGTISDGTIKLSSFFRKSSTTYEPQKEVRAIFNITNRTTLVPIMVHIEVDDLIILHHSQT